MGPTTAPAIHAFDSDSASAVWMGPMPELEESWDIEVAMGRSGQEPTSVQ